MCPFMATTANLGPQTVCLLHRDYNNLSFGLCGIIALGDFDHTKGGHLYLKEANVVLEVGRGDTVFIPSACITHGNLPISPSENRFSITLYTAGQLFHWVRNGMRPVNELPVEAQKEDRAQGPSRWAEGWKMHTTVADLRHCDIVEDLVV